MSHRITEVVTIGTNHISRTFDVPEATGLVDLGVLHATDLTAGPQTLYTPTSTVAVQLLNSADSFVAMDAMTIDVNSTSRVTVTSSLTPLLQWAPAQTVPFGASGPTIAAARVVPTEAIIASLQTDTTTKAVLSTPPAWASLHLYAANFLILGPDAHLWSSGAGGTSAGTIPDFAGNEAGTVADGTVTWTDEGHVPTTGALHLYAIVTPL